jgi:hypothetical protein
MCEYFWHPTVAKHGAVIVADTRKRWLWRDWEKRKEGWWGRDAQKINYYYYYNGLSSIIIIIGSPLLFAYFYA